MDTSTEQLAKTLSRYQGWVTGGLCFIVVFSITVMGILFWQTLRIGASAQQIRDVSALNQHVLCAQKTHLQLQIRQSEAFLKSAEDDTIFGIPTQIIEQSLADDRATLTSFNVLKCKGV